MTSPAIFSWVASGGDSIDYKRNFCPCAGTITVCETSCSTTFRRQTSVRHQHWSTSGTKKTLGYIYLCDAARLSGMLWHHLSPGWRQNLMKQRCQCMCVCVYTSQHTIDSSHELTVCRCGGSKLPLLDVKQLFRIHWFRTLGRKLLCMFLRENQQGQGINKRVF